MSSTEVLAWLAVISSATALLAQGWRILRDYRKERTEVKIALDRNPIIAEQLALGNVSQAVKELNAIIVSQAQHIDRQDKRIADLEEDLDVCRTRMDRREEELLLTNRSQEREIMALLEQIDDLKGLLARARENQKGDTPDGTV